MEPWELSARERIRDTLAQYTWSGDGLRLDVLAEAFCPDGVLEVRGQPPHQGREAIVGFIGGVGAGPAASTPTTGSGAPKIVRHNVTNVRFVELTPDQARVESYFSVFTDIGLDHLGRYRDVFEPVGDRWLIRHRFVSTDWRADGSTMAAPSSLPGG